MNFKRVLSALLASVMMLSCLSVFTACKKEKEPEKEKRTNVYSGEEIELPEGVTYVNNLLTDGKRVVFSYNKDFVVVYNEKGEEQKRVDGYNFNEQLPEGWYINYQTEMYLCSFDIATKNLNQIPLKIDNDKYGYGSMYRLTDDGKLLTIRTKWEYSEDYSESNQSITALVLDIDTANIEKEYSLNETVTNAGLDLSSTYINNILSAENGNFYIVLQEAILTVDSEMKLLNTTKIENGFVNMVCPVGDKLICTLYYNDGRTNDVKILENGNFVDPESELFKDLFKNYINYIGSDGSKIFYSASEGIRAYDFETDTDTEVLNFLNSDLDPTMGYQCQILDDGRILAAYTDYMNSTPKVALQILSKVPDEQLTDEIIVRVGAMYSDAYLMKSIIRYNKQNNGTRIVFETYHHLNNEENKYKGAEDKIKNDVITGNLPDILVLDQSLPIDSFFQQDAFIDLNEYMDGDENGIDRSKYLENILKATTVDGKQYSMILNFNISTLLAKEKYVGPDAGWTFEEMMSCINSMPEDMIEFLDYGRENIISNFFYNSMSSFVNWEDGTTSFESQGFIDFIKYLSTCPEFGFWEQFHQGNKEEYDEEAYKEREEYYALRFFKDRALFQFATISSFDGFFHMNSQFATNEVTPIGYPTNKENGNGASINPITELAISTTSHAKKQAWDILKFILEDETYMEQMYGFSVNKKVLEDKYEKIEDQYKQMNEGIDDGFGVMVETAAPALGRAVVVEATEVEVDSVETEIAEEETETADSTEITEEDSPLPETDVEYFPGKPGGYDDYQWMVDAGYSEEYIEFMRNSRVKYDQESVDKVKALIYSASEVVRSDSELLNIINEDLSSFFGGTKSAEETAKVIANRVRTYIAENS